MKKYFLFFIPLLISILSSAQNCTEALLLQKPGVWKAGMKGSEGGTAADLGREKKSIAAIHNMIKSKYTPMSMEALFHGAYNPPYPNMPANSFYYSILPLNYYCQDNSFKTVHETSTSFQIAANMMALEIYDSPGEDNVSGMGYHYMPDMPVEKDGYYYFKEKDITLPFGVPGKTSGWLITFGGKLPYAYVTKKEFLEKRKRLLLKGLPQVQAGFKETLKNNELTKAMKEIEYKDQPEKLKHWMKMDYQGIKERYEKFLLDSDKPYKIALAKIETQLKMSAGELNLPAIVKMDPHDHLSYLFTDDNDGFGKVLIKPNPGYFNNKLSRSTPQFFSVYVTGSHKDIIYARFMAGVINAVDFAILKNMLGKEPGKLIAENNNSNPTETKSTKTEVKPIKNELNIYKNEATPGFKTTTVSQMKKAAQLPAPVNSKIKSKAISTKLNAATLPGYMNQLLVDVEKNLDQQQLKNGQLLYAKLKNSPVDLADAGVMLYYKGAVNEAIWCLSKAAAMKPGSDYILSNLTGIMNLAQAEARALPILRFLKSKHPGNTTVLNNLGQALYVMGEFNSSKAILDSCIRIFAYHPQANYTRAIIAEKEGKDHEAAAFIQKSLKGAYSDKTNEFAERKGIKLDYGNILNRYRPAETEYINPQKYRPPSQCTNVYEAAVLEAEWDAWGNEMKEISSLINAGLGAASVNYQKSAQQMLLNKTAPVFNLGPLHGKAEKLYKIYLDKAGLLQEEAQTYLGHKYAIDKADFETIKDNLITKINKKYNSVSGEGKGDHSADRCAEINTVNNNFLAGIAGLNNAFHARFTEPLRQLNIEMMYWSQMMPGPAGFREMLYYERAMFAVNALVIKSMFIQPCTKNEKGNANQNELDLPEAYCPISFKFKAVIAKVTGDCSKFEIEFEFEGLVLNLERDFINKKSTIAFGAGASLNLKGETVGDDIPECIEIFGGGVGVKMQGFIEIDVTGISDFGLRGEAAIEGMGTDKGDIKINGKIGVNSGVDITPSPALENIGKALNESFLK